MSRFFIILRGGAGSGLGYGGGLCTTGGGLGLCTAGGGGLLVRYL